MDERGSRTPGHDVETDLIETELLAQRRPPPRPALVSTEVLPSRKIDSGAAARFAAVGRAGRVYEVGTDGVHRGDPIRCAVHEGFQCLIGLDFASATHALARSGEGGLAILDGAGSTSDAIAALKSRGVLPVVHNVGFSSNVMLTEARRRTVDEAADAAKKGFAGVFVDELCRPPNERDAADLKKTIEAARAAAGHASFTSILRNGDTFLLGFPWLVDLGLVSAVVIEGVSYRSSARGHTGMRVTSSERRGLDARIAKLRGRFPDLPLVALDHPRDRSQAEMARERARGLGFDVAHVAIDDALCERLSPLTSVGMQEDDPTVPGP